MKALKEMNGTRVLSYSFIDRRHKPTGNCRHNVAGELIGSVSGLTICPYDDKSFYLFYCDENWNVITDTWHQSLEDAMHQAEFECQGVGDTWSRIE